MVQFGAGTGSDYGTGVIDSKATLVSGEIITKNFQDDVQDAVVAIQTLLGAAPEGAFASVQTRLNEHTVAASDAAFIIRDTDGVWGVAIPSLVFEDSAQTVGGRLKFDANEDLIVENLRSAKDIYLNTTAGGQLVTNAFLAVNNNVRIAQAAAQLFLSDDDAATDIAVVAVVVYERSDLTAVGRVGFLNAGDGHFEITNLVSGGNIEFLTNAGVVISDSDIYVAHTGFPRFIAQDTGTAVDNDVQGVFEIRDSIGTVLVQIGKPVTASADCQILNAISNGGVEFDINGTGIVHIDNTNTPTLALRDTGTGVDTGVLAQFEIQDNTAATMALLGMTSGSDGHLELLNNINGANIELTTTGTGNAVQVSRRLDVGTPTSPQEGAGFINAQAVYDDGTLLTGYVLDAAMNRCDLGQWDAYAGGLHQPARAFALRARECLDLDQYTSYWKTQGELPNMPTREQWLTQKLSLGELSQKNWESVEIHAVHLAALHERLVDLERIVYGE